jgi:hypothetical protein
MNWLLEIRMSQPSRMSIPLFLVALMFGGLALAQSPDADIEAVQRKLDAAKQAQAAKDAAAKREADQRSARAAAAAASEARMATLLFRTDADCALSINGEAQGVLAVGQTKSVKVNPGDQIVDCVSTESSAASISEVKTATAGTQSAVVLQLAGSLQQARAQQAAAAQQQALRNRFTAQGDGTVRDSQTGVIWAAQDNGSDIDWNGARNYCASRGGDWSLPTVAQLQGLVDSSGALKQQCGSFTCNVTPSIRLSSFWFWSSEPNGSSEAWGVYLANGTRNSPPVGLANTNRALCVRRS